MSDSRNAFLHCLRSDLLRHRSVIRGQNEGPTWPALFSPRFAPVLLHRLAHGLALSGLGPLARLISLINFTVFGIEIAVLCPIGPGLVLPHTQGTVIGAARIGSNATIFQGVTLGAREIDVAFDPRQRPTVGDGVVIGAGAKVLGGVRLGDRSCIGANAVVLNSVPDDALAVGVPARMVSRKQL